MNIIIEIDKNTPRDPYWNCHIFENVLDLSNGNCTPDIKILLKDPNKNIGETKKKMKFLVLTCSNPSAYAHVFFEFFSYLKTIKKIIDENEGIKILSLPKKQYIKNLLLLFGIKNEVVYGIPEENICYFVPLMSLNEKDVPLIEFEENIKYVIDYLEKDGTNETNETNKKNKKYNVFFPRQTVENYGKYDYDVKDILKNFVKSGNDLIIDTFALNNIITQNSIIKNAKMILLDFGSSFFCNGIMAKNSNIYVLCTMPKILDGVNTNYSHYNYLCKFISSRNNVIFLRPRTGITFCYLDLFKLIDNNFMGKHEDIYRSYKSDEDFQRILKSPVFTIVVYKKNYLVDPDIYRYFINKENVYISCYFNDLSDIQRSINDEFSGSIISNKFISPNTFKNISQIGKLTKYVVFSKDLNISEVKDPIIFKASENKENFKKIISKNPNNSFIEIF